MLLHVFTASSVHRIHAGKGAKRGQPGDHGRRIDVRNAVTAWRSLADLAAIVADNWPRRESHGLEARQ
jgi:hypothetical protein